MVWVGDISPGIRVKIVDEWGPGCHQNWSGRMDKFLGKILTVREIIDDLPLGGYFTVEEDAGSGGLEGDGHWAWFPAAVEFVIPEEEIDAPTESQIDRLIEG